MEMETVFLNIAEDLRMEELIERDFPELRSESSKKDEIKKVFGIADFSSISTEDLALKFSMNPTKIRDIYTFH